MSTNPFRRSSLKGPSGSSGGSERIPIASAPIDIPDAGSDTPTSVNVDNKASTNQKHVNFASPPAIPISPVSYPSSPESTRFSPEYAFAQPILPGPTDYSQAMQSNPFRIDTDKDENDPAIAQALQNAQVNNTLATVHAGDSKQDAVKDTLSRFASAPRKHAPSNRDHPTPQIPVSHRQTMDVDAFKRLLLTGGTGGGSRSEDGASAIVQHATHAVNDNSSSTDTASISQRSLFDQGVLNEGSSRSSNEIDLVEGELIRHSIEQNEKVEGKKKPPPPTPKHGKPLKEESVSESYSDPASSQTSLASNITKKAPIPPLARRHSQNNSIQRPPSSRMSSSSDIETTGLPESTSNSGSKTVPPPPRTRRPVSTMDRRSSSDLPTTLEESESVISSVTPSRKPSDSRPPPPPSRNSSKRVSMGTLHAPPLPPPRRGRVSSRSSIDGQTPQVATVLDESNFEPTNIQPSQPGIENRSEPSETHATDILADLAALQREVDEARRKGSR